MQNIKTNKLYKIISIYNQYKPIEYDKIEITLFLKTKNGINWNGGLKSDIYNDRIFNNTLENVITFINKEIDNISKEILIILYENFNIWFKNYSLIRIEILKMIKYYNIELKNEEGKI